MSCDCDGGVRVQSAASILRGIMGGMLAYLDGVNCNGQLDHFVVFWDLILYRATSAGSYARSCGGAYLVGEGEEVSRNRSATARCQYWSRGLLRRKEALARKQAADCAGELTSCPLLLADSRGTSGPWPWWFLWSRTRRLHRPT
jgi:hypothetical protein